MPTAKKTTKDKVNWEEKLEELTNAIGAHKGCGGCKPRCHNNSGSAIYGLGIIGAAFYYFQHMPVSSELVSTIVKVLLWPAFVAYRLIETFGL